MPSRENVARQRTWGGLLGVAVLAGALSYHFFPRLFHVDGTQSAPRRAMALPKLTSGTASSSPVPAGSASLSELDAGPPLTLAPAAVIAARRPRNTVPLPEQVGVDSPQVEALLKRADTALAAGQLAGEKNSAAALYQKALELQPDSRRGLQGLTEVRARLAATVGQDIAVGDAESAHDLLDTLAAIPGSEKDVATLQASLARLNKVRPMLARAAVLLQQGKVDEPAGDSALSTYRQVLQADAGNAVARQGLLQVQRALLDRALAAAAQNDFKSATAAVDEAAPVSPGSTQLGRVRSQVQAIRQQRSTGLLAQARSALDGGNLGVAGQLADQAGAIDPDVAGLQDFRERMVNARLYAGYRPGQNFNDGFVDIAGNGPAMVVVRTGSFLMGSPASENGHLDSEGPQHTVTFSQGMAMARSEITVGQFRQFVRSSGYRPQSVSGGASVYDERTGAMRQDNSATWQSNYAGRSAADDLPVVNVSWNDAHAYAAWLSQRTGKTYRLPSEAQYEYAERAGTTTPYWWGSGTPGKPVENLTGSNDRSPRGRRWSNAFKGYRDGDWGPAPVASLAANPFGLYDMDGNVSEWVEDCWHESYLRAPRDGSAWVNPGCSARVIRGGSWGSSPSQDRSAYRQGVEADVRSGRIGFRVMRVL